MISHELPSKYRPNIKQLLLMPRKQQGQGLSFDRMQYETREILDCPDSPGKHIEDHFNALRNGWCEKNNSLLGNAFEWCIYDALIKYAIAENQVYRGVNLTKWIQPLHNNNDPSLEIDFLCEATDNRPAVCIGAKTSLRERWTQFLPPALLAAEHYRQEPLLTRGRIKSPVAPIWVGLMFKEHPDKRSNNAREADRVKKYDCHYLRIRSTVDYKSMRELFEFIKTGKRPDWLEI